jgi:transcriptional regulator with XRE-family HTH domain
MPANHTRQPNPASVLTGAEALAHVQTMIGAMNNHQAEQADRIHARDRDIIIKQAKGWTIKEIARDKGISDGHVRQILTLNGVSLPKKATPALAQYDAIYGGNNDGKDAKQGSADLRNVILFYHLRRGTIPPGMSANQFIDRCRSAKLPRDIIESAIDAAIPKAGAAA